MKKYKCYIFDFDLTLMDTVKGIIDCFRYALSQYNEITEPFGITDDDLYKTIGTELVQSLYMLLPGVDDLTIEKIAGEFRDGAAYLMTAGTVPYPYTEPMLRNLRSQGVKCAITSSKRGFRIEEALVKFGIDDCFDIVVGSDMVKEAKPHPESVYMVLEALKVDASDVLYVGDSVTDAQTAMNAGVDFAGVTTGPSTEQELAAYPNVVIMKDLTRLIN